MKTNPAVVSALGRTSARQDAPDGAQAIRRAIEVVRVVAQLQRSGANLSRVARATGLATSTAFRMLRSLTEERLLRYDPVGRTYWVGPLAFELGLAVSTETPGQSRWRYAVEEVASETRLTTYLMARSENDAVCLLCSQGSTALRAVPMEIGQRLPLGVGAGSLAILSSLDDMEIERVLAAQRSRLELYPGGKAMPERVVERVERTRQQGFALSSGIVAVGAVGIGVAIPSEQELTQHAISVSAVESTINPASIKQIASLIAAAIERHRR